MDLELSYKELKENVNKYQMQRAQAETKKELAFQQCQEIREKYGIQTREELEALYASKDTQAQEIITESSKYLQQCNEQIQGI